MSLETGISDVVQRIAAEFQTVRAEKVGSAGSVTAVEVMSQAEYDGMTSHDPTTLYYTY